MMIEITKTEILEDSIKITGLAIEDVLMADDLYEEYDEVPEVSYEFDRSSTAHMKYLWKICQSQKRCQREKSMGLKLDKLVSVITNVSESFRI